MSHVWYDKHARVGEFRNQKKPDAALENNYNMQAIHFKWGQPGVQFLKANNQKH